VIARVIGRPIGAPIGRSIAQPGVGGFSLASIFAGGKQGIVGNLSDLSALFQDTAGTTPVTTSGQTVRRINDTSGNGNHLTNATGWVLTIAASGNYLTTDGVSRFEGAGAIAWNSDKASIIFGAKKNSGTGGTLFQFGNVVSQTGAFELLYQTNDLLAYRRGSSTFGARQTQDVSDLPLVASTVFDLSGAAHAAECPYLRHSGAAPSLTNAGTSDSGSGNFGTYTMRVSGGQSHLTGRVYSFVVVAAALTLGELEATERWVAQRAGVTLMDQVAPEPQFMETGAVTDMGTYDRTSPFAYAEYTTEATEIYVSGISTVYPSFPSYAEIGIYVDGVLHTTIQAPNSSAFSMYAGLPAGSKTVRFVNGLTSSPLQSLAYSGTFLTGIAANATMTAVTSTPADRIVVYGDSIAVGANATNPVSEGWPVVLRENYAPDSLAVEGFGYRSLYIDCTDSTLRAAFVAKIAAYFASSTGTQRIWLAIGTNDYGLNKQNATLFGTMYAAVLDDLHTALPSASIYCQSPIVRTDETANIFGHTLGDYRTQISTAAAARPAYCTYVDGSVILTTGDLDDGVHPTTAGHALYAAAVATALGI
jgi:lysophospholipase L1-like esterase